MGFIDTLLGLNLHEPLLLTRIEEPLLLLWVKHLVPHLLSQHDGVANRIDNLPFTYFVLHTWEKARFSYRAVYNSVRVFAFPTKWDLEAHSSSSIASCGA